MRELCDLKFKCTSKSPRGYWVKILGVQNLAFPVIGNVSINFLFIGSCDTLIYIKSCLYAFFD